MAPLARMAGMAGIAVLLTILLLASSPAARAEQSEELRAEGGPSSLNNGGGGGAVVVVADTPSDSDLLRRSGDTLSRARDALRSTTVERIVRRRPRRFTMRGNGTFTLQSDTTEYTLLKEQRVQQQQQQQQQGGKKKKDEPLVVFWTQSQGVDVAPFTKQCPKSSCTLHVTSDRRRADEADAIIFNGFDLTFHEYPFPPKRAGGPIWAFWSTEAPTQTKAWSMQRCGPAEGCKTSVDLSQFDMLISYRQDSDIMFNYMPCTMDELFAERRTGPGVSQLPRDGSRNHMFWMAGNCNWTWNGRLKYVTELNQHFKVDAYGKCMHNHDFPPQYKSLGEKGQFNHLNNTWSPGQLFDFLSAGDYKFYLAYENADCPDYVSEKFWWAIQSGLVPVYHGAPNIDEFMPVPGMIVNIADYKSPAELAKKLQHLVDHPSEYNAMLQYKKDKKVSAAFRKRWEEVLSVDPWCKLCQTLQNKDSYVRRPVKPNKCGDGKNRFFL